MDVFKTRVRLFEDFKKNRIDFNSLTGETYRQIKRIPIDKIRMGDHKLEYLYLRYLLNLCKLERRLGFEYHLIKSGFSSKESFQRVGGHHFDQMSLASTLILKKELTNGSVPDFYLAPKGVVILSFQNSPIGKILIKRSDLLTVVKSFKHSGMMTPDYLKILLSFL